MSQVTRISEEMNQFRAGIEIELAYEIPSDAWYFRNNAHPTMPFCVLLEAALQPCGWLASAVGSALRVDEELYFRNLDGTGVLHKELLPDSGTLLTTVRLTNISQSAGMIIQSFDVKCHAQEELIYTLSTVFGFFPAAALANQVGLPTSHEQRKELSQESDFTLDLTTAPERYFGRAAALPKPMLCMLDRITGWSSSGGSHQLGWIRGEKDVDPAEWFFKAHFFQDPVQPGSLGIEALLQLLQFHMLASDQDLDIEEARFEPIALRLNQNWSYRGQVVPENQIITTTMNVVAQGVDDRGAYVLGNGSLWVDGKRIYEVEKLGMRLISKKKSSGKPTQKIKEWRAKELLNDSAALWSFWRSHGLSNSSTEHIYQKLIRSQVAHFEASAQIPERPVVFLANHQTAMESLMFCILSGALIERPVVGLAKEEHTDSWFGRFICTMADHPQLNDFNPLVFLNRTKAGDLLELRPSFEQLLKDSGLLVHIEGTRSLSEQAPVLVVSAFWIDLMRELDGLIVPVGFSGGLSDQELGKRDLPRFKQSIVIGDPIAARKLPLELKKSKKCVLDRIQELLGRDRGESLPQGDGLELCADLLEEELKLVEAEEGEQAWVSSIKNIFNPQSRT